MRDLPMCEFPKRLIDGYRGFRSGRLRGEQSRYRELADRGQSPEVMVIGCCDSRVSPEIIFDAQPGELFVVRNVANLVPPYDPDGAYHGVSAALEFALQELRVKHIVVLGHARCGGVRAYAERHAPLSPSDFIGKWVSMIAPAAEAAAAMQDRPDFLTELEHASIATTLSNLMTFPYVSSLARCGKLSLHGAYFDVATGQLEARDPITGRFEEVAAHNYEPLRGAFFGRRQPGSCCTASTTGASVRQSGRGSDARICRRSAQRAVAKFEA